MLSAISVLKNSLRANNLEGMIILDENNIFYLTGLDCPGMLVIMQDENLFLTYDKYVDYAEAIVTIADMINVCSIEDSQDLRTVFGSSKRVGIEKRYMTVADYNYLTDIFDAEFFDISDTIASMREVKDDDAIAILEENSKILDSILEDTRKELRKGVTENSIYEYIIMCIHTNDMEKIDVSVSFGKNTLGPKSNREDSILEDEDIVIITIAAKKDGYVSKIARTYFTKSFVENNEEVIADYNSLLKIHDYMLRTIKNGESISKISRDIIAKIQEVYWDNKYDLGAGIGIEEKEMPYISENTRGNFKENMVLCITPKIENADYMLALADVIVLTSVNYITLTKTKRDIADVII